MALWGQNGPSKITVQVSKISLCSYFYPRADGAKRRAKVLIPPGYLHPEKRKHLRSLKFINNRVRDQRSTILSGWSSSLISKIWLIACRSGISKISILKDIYFENRLIYNKLEAVLFEEMRRIDLLWEIVKYTASLLEYLMFTNFVALTFCLKT